MKKLLAALLVLTLCLCVPFAFGEENALTRGEIDAYCADLMRDALALPAVSPEKDEDGSYRFDFDEFALYSPDAKLSKSSVITAVELLFADHSLADMRGVGPTNSLEAVLSAYPLDNEALAGTREEAALYLRGALPGEASSGRVLRDGSRALVIEYSAYETKGDSVTKSCVVYAFDSNDVCAVTLYPAAQVMTLAEAKAELEALSDLQEKSEYVAQTDGGEAFSREDMTFFGVDFITASPEDVLSILGKAQNDAYMPDGSGFMRVMQWDGTQAVFACDQNKRAVRLLSLTIDGEKNEGPRGLRVGDTISRTLARFPQNIETGALYGDGVTPPYGVFESGLNESAARYAARIENDTVLLMLTFVEGRLAEINCAYL